MSCLINWAHCILYSVQESLRGGDFFLHVKALMYVHPSGVSFCIFAVKIGYDAKSIRNYDVGTLYAASNPEQNRVTAYISNMGVADQRISEVLRNHIVRLLSDKLAMFQHDMDVIHFVVGDEMCASPNDN